MAEMTFSEVVKRLVDGFQEMSSAWEERASGYYKTPHTKSITLQNWNSLVTLLARTETYVRGMYAFLSSLEELGAALDNVGTGQSVAVDEALSATSTNAVQNKAIYGRLVELDTALQNLRTIVDTVSSRENLVNTLGEASESSSGLMSSNDKVALDSIAVFLNETSGENDFVDTISEIVYIFRNYSEELNLASKLANIDSRLSELDTNKLSRTQVDARIAEKTDSAMSESSTNPVQNRVVKAYVDSMNQSGVIGGTLTTICNTVLGLQSDGYEYTRLNTSVTMCESVTGLESCIVYIDGVSEAVSLDASGHGSIDEVRFNGGAEGITCTLNIDGNTLSLSNPRQITDGGTFESSFSEIIDTVSVVVQATLVDGDVAICTDFPCVHNGSYPFSISPALKNGQTVQIRLGPIDDCVYENITYPMSSDYGILWSSNEWAVVSEDGTTLRVHDYGGMGSPETIQISIVALHYDESSSGSGGSGNTNSSSKLSKVFEVYPYTSVLLAPWDSSKTYLIDLKGYQMGELSMLMTYVFNQGVLLQYGSSDAVNVYENSGYIVCSYDPASAWTSVFVHIQEIDAYEVTCFIEGTPILLRNPITKEVYSKNIEDVKHFDYCAYWMPNLGRLTASRVIAPPIVGECTEYDRLYFSDGTEVNVFGTQFFWHADKDMLVNWRKLTPEDRVCTSEGNLVHFVKSEHIVSDKPVKHYTLMVFMGKYLANGIQVGDKRELFYPRMIESSRKRYWDKLTEADQKHLIRVHNQGMTRRNWKSSPEYRSQVKPIDAEIAKYQGIIDAKKDYLDSTDYLVLKLMEGKITIDEFEPYKGLRQSARDEINAAEVQLEQLTAERTQIVKEIRDAILGTHVPKFAGKFVGKTKAIL